MKTILLLIQAVLSVLSLEAYNLVQTVNLSVAGTSGGHGDWVAYDSDTSTVWLSHGPDQNLVVLNSYSPYHVRVIIPNVQEGNGIAFSSNFAFVADNGRNLINVYDKYTYELLQQISTPGGPDGIYWNPDRASIWVTLDNTAQLVEFASRGQLFNPTAATTINLNTTVNGSAGPDVGIYVSQLGLFFQPIDHFINVINMQNRHPTLQKVWTFPTNGSIKGVAYDYYNNNLLFGTNAAQAFIVSAYNGRIIRNITLPGNVDESVIVPSIRRGFLGDSAGYVDVINLDTGARLNASFSSGNGAHTLTAFIANHRLTVFSYFGNDNQVGVFTSNQTY